MATARSQINQVFLLGAESEGTPGTLGTANQLLGTFNSQVAPVASGAFGVFRQSGGKYAGQIVPADIYAEGPFTDTIDLNTISFLFAGNVGYAAPVAGPTPTTGYPQSYTWTHTPVPYARGTQRTFVAQEGETGAVYNYRQVGMPDLNLRFMRTGASQVGGRILGRKLNPGTTLTTPVTRLGGRAINGIHTGVWEAPDWATLTGVGATRLAPLAIDLAWRHNGVLAPWFGLDDNISSFAGTLEGQIDTGVQISVLADVTGTDISGAFKYASMEEGTFLFIKVLNTGPLIDPGPPAIRYFIEGDMCLQIAGPPRRSAVGNLRVWQWDATCIPDLVDPFLPFKWTVLNTLPPTAIPHIV